MALYLGLLFSSAVFRSLAYVLAAPVSVQDASQSKNDSAFQTIATGTQDLAALVGLFATDSVERYSVDYSRGYLSVAVATCSLLGIMGYVRALVKLAMGAKSCDQSAFPTAPVRSLLGVSKLDRLPKEELVTVSYISRMTNNKNEMIYYMVKEVDHTRDSFPATMAEPKDLTHDLRLLYIPKMKGGHPTRIRGPATIPEPGLRSNRLALMIIWGSLGLAAAATSFPVVCVSSAWTWSRVLATFGMFFGLAISSIMWSYVYVVEQIPSPMPGLTSSKSVNSDTHSFKIAEFRNSSGSSESSIPARTSPKRAADYENFAVIRPEKRSKQLIFCNLETYVEIKYMSTVESAWWLGVQTTLALVRITIWIWDPAFDNYIDRKCSHYAEPIENDHIDGWELAGLHFTSGKAYEGPNKYLRLPMSLLERLGEISILDLLIQAKDIVDGDRLSAKLDEALLMDGTVLWMLPPTLFAKWLGYRNLNRTSIEEPSKSYNLAFINIKDPVSPDSEPWEKGEIHVLPMICSEGGSSYIATHAKSHNDDMDNRTVYIHNPWEYRYEGGSPFKKSENCSVNIPYHVLEDITKKISKELDDAISWLNTQKYGVFLGKSSVSGPIESAATSHHPGRLVDTGLTDEALMEQPKTENQRPSVSSWQGRVIGPATIDIFGSPSTATRTNSTQLSRAGIQPSNTF
ncbi:hypothetical protein FPQ18DRAFT_307045 [Pyronema domesticum]|nr:hypothetical protein FPQ18DRAFT_307045 [Pyronema domesticum]